MLQNKPKIHVTVLGFVIWSSLCSLVLSSCTSGQFECQDGTCIAGDKQCDDYFHCKEESTITTDHTDELNCSDPVECPEGQEVCSDNTCRAICLTTEEPTTYTATVGVSKVKDADLGKSEIIAIVIPICLVVLLIIAILIYFKCCKRNNKSSKVDCENENLQSQFSETLPPKPNTLPSLKDNSTPSADLDDQLPQKSKLPPIEQNKRRT